MAERRGAVIWSPEARADLSEIWDYYVGAAGRHSADTIIRGFTEACIVLEEHPLAGRARDEVRPGLRSMAASPHIVFYRVRGRAVEIVRVLDGRRDLDEVFSREPQ